MDKLTKQQKQELARLLYMRGDLTQKEIAVKVGIAEMTMMRWIADGRWKEMKTTLSATREEQLRRLYMQLSQYNDDIESREDGKRYPTVREADAMNKIAATIERLEKDVGATDILNVSKKFLDWLRTFDLTKAQELSELFDAFLRTNL